MTNRIYQAFKALRQSGLGEPETWRPIYRAGLVEAFQGQRFDEAAELAIFAAASLEAQGHYEEAVAELEFGLGQSDASAPLTAKLLGVLASMQAIRGDRVALDSVASATALLPYIDQPEAAVRIRSYAALVACVFLDADSVSEARQVADQAQSQGAAWIARGLDIWAVPAMVAQGQRRRAGPWVNALAAHAEAEGSVFRQADAAALEYGLRSVGGLEALDAGPFDRAPRNNMAAWRTQITALHNAVRLGHAEDAARAVGRLEALAQRLNPGHRDGLAMLREAARLAVDDVQETLVPPEEVTLVNLPAVLAAMEVVATRGVQEQAVQWARWAEAKVPAHVRTSVEWPASRDRVQALLLVRLGNERAGTALMERAYRWTRSAGYPLEAALCEVQLSSLLALGRTAAPERRWSLLRRAGRATLREAGIPSAGHELATTEALAFGRVADAEPKLSPREVEVLGLLADGLTYKQTGERLGIEWRTVQVHARRVYEKLGVSGKMLAARRARELGII